jgi:hypothetical protein
MAAADGRFEAVSVLVRSDLEAGTWGMGSRRPLLLGSGGTSSGDSRQRRAATQQSDVSRRVERQRHLLRYTRFFTVRLTSHPRQSTSEHPIPVRSSDPARWASMRPEAPATMAHPRPRPSNPRTDPARQRRKGHASIRMLSAAVATHEGPAPPWQYQDVEGLHCLTRSRRTIPWRSMRVRHWGWPRSRSNRAPSCSPSRGRSTIT